ncbi:hypothetical protein FBALC1_01107 [Flavobacteriales bacterium ALC-1]|nr:hypothetical protein FBALC1_01107 [Flavobacteriales bacterium ALC-1]
MSFIKDIMFKVWKNITSNSQPIFIMAHMRSGSSLLEHILSSNEEIFGAGEQSRVYNTYDDLKKGELFIRRVNKRLFKPCKYIADQVLHKKFTPNLDFIRSNSIKVVFLIRTPAETISSIEKLGGPYGVNEIEEFSSSEYYINRLEYLVNLSTKIPKDNQIVITYKELVSETDNTLKKLTAFLDLKTSLKKEYNIKKTTGKLGDTSKNIKAGTIIKTNRRSIEIDEAIKAKLDASYKETCLLLRTKN